MRDPKTENQLDRGKFAYQFVPAFQINKIDLAASKANPARLNRKIDEERCLEMACAMEAGVEFPAIVLTEEPNGTFIVATGMHRLIAATELLKPMLATFDAYIVIEPDPYRRELLMRSINCIEGRGQSRDENLAHCAEMYRLYNRSVDDLAAAFNLRVAAIREYLRSIKFDERADQLGVGDLSRGWPQKTKQQLATIKIDAVLADAVRYLKSAKLTGPATKELITQLANCRGEKAGFKILDERRQEAAEREESAKAKYGRRNMDIPTKAMRPVRTILAFCAKYGNDPSKLQWGALEQGQLGRDLTAVKDLADLLDGWINEMSMLLKHHEKKSWAKPSAIGEPASADTSASE
jgi:hypothetical protein